MEKIRVMVTDDHPAFREGLTRLLREETDMEVIATLGNGDASPGVSQKLETGCGYYGYLDAQAEWN